MSDPSSAPATASDPAPDAPLSSRGERKERTRRAILDAALTLCEDSSLVALSLRQVAKEVGIVPTAFYRHFDSIEALGLALVDESFVSLRAMLRDVRRSDPDFDDIIDGSIRTLVDHVHAEHAHFLFIARERAAGPPAVREAIRHEIELCERELAADLASLPQTLPWAPEDWQALSNLMVMAMVATAERILSAPAGHHGGGPGGAGGDRDGAPEDADKAIIETARTQLRMVLVGALNWRSKP